MWGAGISDEEDGTAELKNQPQKIEIFGTLVIAEDRVLKGEKQINLPPRSCPICQLQKTKRMKNQAKSILPDIPLAPNEKLSLDIFGQLPETQKGNRYILSMQDRLTRYTLLVPLQNESTNSIIEALINHYIYTLGDPKTILSDQGSNFLSELMTQFENALNIRHIKTTAFQRNQTGTSEECTLH